MRIALLAVGNELLSGETQETNSRELAITLAERGLALSCVRVIADDRGTIVANLRELTSGHDVVVTSGGLGPTPDDLTAEAIAEFMGVPLELDLLSLSRIREFFLKRRRAFAKTNEKQALLPAGATALPNETGTAPGFLVEQGDAMVIAFPGVPAEFRDFVARQLLPRVDARHKGPYTVRRILRCFGLPESTLAEKLEGLDSTHAQLEYQAVTPEILIKVVSTESSQEAALSHAAVLVNLVRDRVGEWVYGEGTQSLPEIVGAALLASEKTIATAESCTGGLIAHFLTNTPGSSAYFPMGVVSYANEQKSRLLGVPPQVLTEHGAVSEATVRWMAEGVRVRAGTDMGIAVSGIAGPGGGSVVRPVGLVHIALAKAGETVHQKFHFNGDRMRIKLLTAYAALDLIRRNC